MKGEAIVRELPCSPVEDGKPTLFKFTGFDVGPLFVHRTHDDSKEDMNRILNEWSVTHTRTGFAVKRCIDGKMRAMKLASDLVKLDCWDFEAPADAKTLPKETLARIFELRDSV